MRVKCGVSESSPPSIKPPEGINRCKVSVKLHNQGPTTNSHGPLSASVPGERELITFLCRFFINDIMTFSFLGEGLLFVLLFFFVGVQFISFFSFVAVHYYHCKWSVLW